MKDSLTIVSIFALAFGVMTSIFIGVSFWGITFPLGAVMLYTTTFLE